MSPFSFSESDYRQLDNNNDYVEFYKGSVPSEEPPSDEGRREEEEQLLDYSVESAQTSYLNQDFLALLVGGGVSPTAVPMSKIVTKTPVNIASSRHHPQAPPPPDAKSDHLSESLISQVAASNLSEAPAKFITSKPRITVQKAHTQLAATAAPSFSSVPLTRNQAYTLPPMQERPKADYIQSIQRSGGLPDSKQLGLPLAYFRPEEMTPPNTFTQRPLPIIKGNNYLDVRASNSLNQERSRTHPEQLPSKTPRSLFLKNQKKKLHQQTLHDQHQMERYQQKLLSDTVYQPHAYAQGVGVPLKPPPTYISADPRLSGIYHHHQDPNQSLHCPQDSQSVLYQPQLRSTYSSPSHPGYGIGVSPTYQCASDPGTYPMGQQYPSKQPNLSTVYTKQVTLSQIEQFNAQLNSDTDYVIYPHKDPALSRQEYMDAKQSQVIALDANHHPPPYRSQKVGPLYRSTPNVAGDLLTSFPSYQSLASTHQPGSSSGYSSMARGRCFSQQSLASSFSSAPSTQSLTGSIDPYSEGPSTLPASPSVIRVRSDESILASDESTSLRPPPPYRPKVRTQPKYV